MAQHGVIYNIPSEICQKISRKIDDSAKRSNDDGATTAARSLTAANDGSQCITCVPFLRINHSSRTIQADYIHYGPDGRLDAGTMGEGRLDRLAMLSQTATPT